MFTASPAQFLRKRLRLRSVASGDDQPFAAVGEMPGERLADVADSDDCSSHCPVGFSRVGERFARAGEQVAAVDIADPPRAGEQHRRLQPVAQELQDAAHALGSAHGEALQNRTPDRNGVRAERQGAEHVDATAHAAVDDDRHLAAHGIRDGGQHADAGGQAVKLPPAMVRDLDGRGAGSDGLPRVLGAQKALDHDWEP
jgi:hypothetical protein